MKPFTPNKVKCACSVLGDLCPYCERGFALWFRRSMRSGRLSRFGGAA